MKPMHIAMALLSAAMFFVLAGVFMGVQLELDGTKLVVDTASDIRWQWVFIGTAVVFFFQLFKHLIHRALKLRVVLAGFAGIYHVKQRRKILFCVGRFVVDIADQRGV